MDRKRERHASKEAREAKNASRFDATKTAAINQKSAQNEADYEPGTYDPTAARGFPNSITLTEPETTRTND